MSSISLIVDDRLWFHSVIQTGDLPSFLQILQIPMSSLLAREIRVRLLFMYYFYSILKSVLLRGFSLGEWSKYNYCICSMHVEGVLLRIELDPPPCILDIFCLNFH